ncbi:MAG: hypothetical protein ACFCD0_20645 [Gemmataceae bacterium]
MKSRATTKLRKNLAKSKVLGGNLRQSHLQADGDSTNEQSGSTDFTWLCFAELLGLTETRIYVRKGILNSNGESREKADLDGISDFSRSQRELVRNPPSNPEQESYGYNELKTLWISYGEFVFYHGNADGIDGDGYCVSS